MKEILQAKILNPYRSQVPKGFYDKVKGHTGVDLDYQFEAIPAPCDLTILLNNVQNEMGNVIYAQDNKGYIHVFAHQQEFVHKKGDCIKQGELLGHSGNSGSRTTGAHLHYEVISPTGTNPTMKRLLLAFPGDNVDPLEWVKKVRIDPAQTNIIDQAQKEAILARARQKRQLWSGALNKLKSLFS